MWFDNPVLNDINRMNNLYRQIMESPGIKILESFNRQQKMFQTMAGTLMNPSFQSALKKANYMADFANEINANRLIGIADGVATLCKSPIVGMVQEFSSLMPKYDIAQKMLSSAQALTKHMNLFESVMSGSTLTAIQSVTRDEWTSLHIDKYDEPEIEVTDDGMIVNDETYTVQQLKEEILYGVQEIVRAENRKDKPLNTILTFITIISFLMQIAPCVTKYITPQIEKMLNRPTIEYVIKEKEYIRETANSKSKVISEVDYSEPLGIVDEVKFWRKVKWETDGKEIVGWISKISIGTEEDVNE